MTRAIDRTNRYAINECDITPEDLETVQIMSNKIPQEMPNIFKFKYNPDTMLRLLAARREIDNALLRASK